MFSKRPVLAFVVVGVHQTLRRQPAQNQFQLPAEVVDVLNAAIRAARTKG